MDAITEVQQDSYINPLESLLPEKIVEDLSLKKDCTEDLLKMIKTTSSQNLKKLSDIIFKLSNFSLEKIVELTVSKTRLARYNSTFCIFSYIKHFFENVKKAAEIEALYESVFTSRFRDIDPAIRCMCIQFLTEWILVSNALRDMKYLKYLGWALNDRSDSVRRKAVRSMFKLTRLLKKSTNSIVEFYEKYRNRLIEISLRDVNKNIQKDASKLIMAVFLKNNSVFSREQLIEVLSSDNDVSDSKALVMKKLFPDGVWDFNSIHECLNIQENGHDEELKIARHFNPPKPYDNAHIFKNLINSEADTTSFILNILEFVKNNSACCSKSSLCFLSVLPHLDLSVDPSIFLNLLDTVKDNTKNVDQVLTALASVKSYPLFAAETFKLVDYIMNLVSENDYYVEKFAHLLKKLENDFSIQVSECVSRLSEKHSKILIKYFNIPINQSNDDILAICYGVLWRLIDQDYEWVEGVFLKDLIEVHQDHVIEKENICPIASSPVVNDKSRYFVSSDQYCSLLEMLLFFHTQISESEKSDNTIQYLQNFYNRLHDLVAKSFVCQNTQQSLCLFKLIKAGIFQDFSKHLFIHCDEQVLTNMISSVKEVRTLVLGYFDYLVDIPKNKHQSIARLLSSRISKNEKEKYLLSPIKRLISRKDLLDTVLIYFIPHLAPTEAIVLESQVSNSKFKNLLLRKCRMYKSKEEVTVI